MLPLRNLLAYAENDGPEFALAPPAEDDAIVWAGVVCVNARGQVVTMRRYDRRSVSTWVLGSDGGDDDSDDAVAVVYEATLAVLLPPFIIKQITTGEGYQKKSEGRGAMTWR
jgi:hypothetical protein